MNMILTLLLGLLTVVAGTPGPLSLPDINILPKPNLDPRWSAAETLQITLAFRDAQFMAVAAYDTVSRSASFAISHTNMGLGHK